MKIIAAAVKESLPTLSDDCLPVHLYARRDVKEGASAGADIAEGVVKMGLTAPVRAWDLVSIALSVIAADTWGRRDLTPDGWTREFDLSVGVEDVEFWNDQVPLLESMLRFLTTDRWHVSFRSDTRNFPLPTETVVPDETCASLLSGGIDSLVGVLDLLAQKTKPMVVSQVVLGDGERQQQFGRELGGGLRHLRLNHNALCPGENERSQRARSFVFISYGTLAATTLGAYGQGQRVDLYIPENGLISINPPLTESRVGSLSTRTTHPVFLGDFQMLLQNAGLAVNLTNPYRFSTKGEMMAGCKDHEYLASHAHEATSCGRFRRNGFRHCGRCVPCMIRRAAFLRWGKSDRTTYVHVDLGKNDFDHARYDDVRSAAVAILSANEDGVESLLGPCLSTVPLDHKPRYREVVRRGLDELETLLRETKVL